MTKTEASYFPVVDESFHLIGILPLPRIRQVMFEQSLDNLLVVGELALPAVSVHPDETLYEALGKFLDYGFAEIPIEDEKTGIMGMLRLEDLMRAYHTEMQESAEK